MERKTDLFLVFFLMVCFMMPVFGDDRSLETDLWLGYARGFSFSGQLTLYRAGHWRLPLPLRLGLGHDAFNPGNAADARRIFINDNTGGTVEKDGHLTRINLDMIMPLGQRGLDGARLFAGVRYGRFRGHFHYVGDNEDFDVTGNLWGLGTGVEAAFPLSRRWMIRLVGGGDFFFPAQLYGHDTWYSPDNLDDNPRKNYIYEDADQAINQPKIRIYVLAGVGIRLGK